MPADRSFEGKPAVLDVVALLRDTGASGVARGQVGTVVEILDEETSLVEFTDESGQAFAIIPCKTSDLIVLHYEPTAA